MVTTTNSRLTTTNATESPEEVGIVGGINGHKFTIQEHHLHREDLGHPSAPT
jgi:hypothetical protein